MKVIFMMCLIFSFSMAFATTEHEVANNSPSTQEISKNRACFEEVAQNGCGDPGDDIKQFRSCLNNVFSSLNPDCQKMMSKLYHRKD